MYGLSSSKKTLEELVVRGSTTIRNNDLPFESFHGCEKLKTIRAPMVLMANKSSDQVSHTLSDTLPPAL